jgi:(2Fe-2S) ferredoxin
LSGDILYTKVKIEDVKEILEKKRQNNELLERLCYHNGNKSMQRIRRKPPLSKTVVGRVLKQHGII